MATAILTLMNSQADLVTTRSVQLSGYDAGLMGKDLMWNKEYYWSLENC